MDSIGSELTIDIFVTDCLNIMTKYLNDFQLNELKKTLYILFRDVDISNKCYDLTTNLMEDDTKQIQFFEVSKSMKIAQSSIKQYVRAVWILRNTIGKNFKDMCSIDIKAYLFNMQRIKHWTDSYMHTQYNYLSSFFTFLVNEEIIPKNPMAKIELPRVKQNIEPPFTITEIEEMKEYNAAREKAMVEFFYTSGLRVSSIANIKWKDIDLHDKKVIVHLKGGDTNEAYFNEETVYYLKKMLKERMEKEHRSYEEMMDRYLFVSKKRSHKTHDFEGLTTDGIRYIFNKIGKAVKVADVHPHKFRHSYADESLKRGMSVEALKENMHHKNYDTTYHYAKISNRVREGEYRKYWE